MLFRRLFSSRVWVRCSASNGRLALEWKGTSIIEADSVSELPTMSLRRLGAECLAASAGLVLGLPVAARTVAF